MPPGSASAAARPFPWRASIALLAVYVIWGSTYLAIAFVVQTMPPLLSAGIRFIVAGLIFLGWCALRGAFRQERPTLRHWAAAAIVGGLLLLGGNGLVMLAQERIPSGVAALLVGTLPIWLAVLDGVVNRQGVSRLVVAGLVAGLLGVAILVVPGANLEAVEPIGAAMVIGASLSWAVGSLYARGATLPKSRILSTGMEMFAGGLLLTLVGAAFGEVARVDFAAFSMASLVAVLYLIVFGSLVAFTAYTWLLSNVATSTVSTYAFVNPLVAVALGWLILSEPITPRTIIAGAVIIAAVVAMVYGRPHAPDTEPEPSEHPVIKSAAGPAPGPAEQHAASSGGR